MTARKIIIAAVMIAAFILPGAGGYNCSAQFRDEAFTQNYNPQDTVGKSDTTDQLFSVKEYIGALAHKNTTKIGSLFAGSIICVGGCQIYNRDYWKLPIVYGGIGAGAGLGAYYLSTYNKTVTAHTDWETARDAWLQENPGGTYGVTEPVINTQASTIGKICLGGAGLIYWLTLMDGVKCYDDGREPHPGRATIYSILLPGLGQAYNGEYWKIPIYYGGLLAAGHFLYTNHINYKRYQRIYNEVSTGVDTSSPITADNAKYYRDIYRRYRDYSILATAAVYLLQVIDANVFSYMYDFEVTDDISLNLEPTIIPDASYALGNPYGNSAFGMRIGLTF